MKFESKIIALLLCCVIACTALVGGIAISFSQDVVDTESRQILTLICEKYAEELDALMGRIEQSVDALAIYAEDCLESAQQLSDPEYLEQYTSRLQFTALSMMYSTRGALAVYVRYNPKLAPPTSGLYWGRESEDAEPYEPEKTDLSVYDPLDQQAEWYYIPVSRGEPSWISPYVDEYPNKLIISYVVPIYKDGTLVGVVGMDIDCRVLEQLVDEITVYESGHALLVDVEKGLGYHPQLKIDSWSKSVAGEVRIAILEGLAEENALIAHKSDYMTFRELRNGMYLLVCAPAREANAQRNTLILEILIAIVVAFLIVFFMALALVRRTMAPLKQLSKAAYEVASGKRDVALPPTADDEIGTLSAAFREMLLHLRWHEGQMRALAYKDALTGVKNKAAWDEAMERLNQEIKTDSPVFAVAVFDLNDLKITNDTLGHEAGDALLKSACAGVCKAFAHSPVFRIGGDEFAAILERSDYENRMEILNRFRAEFGHAGAPVRVASGMFEYRPGVDRAFSDVFRRADDAMYENKRQIKSEVV